MHDDGISILGQIARDPHLKLLQRKSYYVSPGPESGGDFVAEESTKWSAFPTMHTQIITKPVTIPSKLRNVP